MLAYAPDRDECRREIRERHQIPADAFVVMFPAKIAEHKSPLHLAQAAEICAGRGSRVHALFVGDGIQRPMVEKYCRDRGVKNVSFTGFVNQSVIPRYYAASDAVAVTSYVDSHPLAVTEAACFGLPVVVSDRIGCLGATDTAREGVNAISYHWGDVSALAEALERLASDGALYRRMSDGALEISKSQDVTVAASLLAEASRKLAAMGKR
jgi:glycosyltransferase involved in cell wall biosynthesis